MKKLKPVTPGEILLEEFLKPMGLSQYRLAKELNKIRPCTVVVAQQGAPADRHTRGSGA